MALPRMNFTGRAALDAAAQVQPLVTLMIYEHAVVLRKHTPGEGMAEYPVDPSQIAQALATKAVFRTGLLSKNTLFVGENGIRRFVIEYRPAQLTGLWLEGDDNPLRVPLPPLVMMRTVSGDRNVHYRVYALRGRPRSERARLYNAPLPHVDGGVCWGSVATPGPDELAGTTLTEDWRNFLGSRFGSHSVAGKSKQYRKDIREQYYGLIGKSVYPMDDLIPTSQRLSDLMKVE